MAIKVGLAFLLLAAVPVWKAGNPPPDNALKLLISVEEPVIAAPFPARVTLHLHNASQKTLWLYRRVRSRAEEGSTLEVALEPFEVKGARDVQSPAQGRVLESAGLPRPKLIRLGPGEDTTEKVTLKLLPGRVGDPTKGDPVWGRYRVYVIYRGKYSNATEIAGDTNALLWQGETYSNRIEIELKPPVGEGAVNGSVIDATGRPLSDVIVSLSDQEERLVDQGSTDLEGRFSFSPLPIGTYWVTVRRPDFNEDSAVFRHVVLTRTESFGSIEFVLYPPDIYEARSILHKPVILFVTDGKDHPLDKVAYEIVWSSGKVLDTLNGEVGHDGLVSCELVPGRNFVTLQRRGCPKQEHRIDVTQGEGVDGFKLAYECTTTK